MPDKPLQDLYIALLAAAETGHRAEYPRDLPEHNLVARLSGIVHDCAAVTHRLQDIATENPKDRDDPRESLSQQISHIARRVLDLQDAAHAAALKAAREQGAGSTR